LLIGQYRPVVIPEEEGVHWLAIKMKILSPKTYLLFLSKCLFTRIFFFVSIFPISYHEMVRFQWG
jgi:hypothetical protein